VLENFNALQLNHGLMEAGYVNHQTISASGPLDHGQTLSVSMTATMDAMGNLVLGTIFISFIITWWSELLVLYFFTFISFF
jgi:hypothetical protein